MGVMCIFEELRDIKGLIDSKREYPVAVKNKRTFSASDGKIKFDPELEQFFNNNMIRITLLHEENHLQQKKKFDRLQIYELLIFLLFWFPFSGLYILSITSVVGENIVLSVIGTVLIMGCIYPIIDSFIGPLILQGRYHELEFDADYYAATSLFEQYFERRPSEILKNVLDTIHDYNQQFANSMPIYKKIFLIPTGIRNDTTHPSINLRIEKIRLEIG